jgi:hypothetical protein
VIGGSGISACAAGGGPLHRISTGWTAPNAGKARVYRVLRATGTEVTPAAPPALVATVPALTWVDPEELPDRVQFTYLVNAQFINGTSSGPSNYATLTAENSPPVANDDSASTAEDTPVDIPVLANDTDVDSAPTSLRVVAGSIGDVRGGTAVLLSDGRRIRFTPFPRTNSTQRDADFHFSYRANDGAWSRNPAVVMSADSNSATVTITVTRPRGGRGR